MAQEKVLIVDDEVNVAKAIKRVLSAAGYETFIADSGFEAGVLLSHIKPDLMTLDLNMPDLTGQGVLAIINQVPELRHTKVLLISGCAKEEMEDLLARGADDFLEKPFDNDELLLKIGRLVRG